MKKLCYILACLLVSAMGYAQTDAISYQAVILNPDEQQLPGNDAPATVLQNEDVSLRFTIINEEGFTEYQEVHNVTTDLFGMVNLFIGEGEQLSDLEFTEVLWRGEPKNLLVEIDFYSLGNFVQLSAEKLAFTPQAFHRDIIGTGDMTIDGTATFNDDFVIEGETSINNNLEVTGNTIIGGNTDIGGSTTIGEDLTVDGITNLNSDFFVNNSSPSVLSGTLDVGEQTVIGGGVEVANEATIGGDTSIGGNTRIEGNTEVGGDQLIEGDLEIRRRLTVLLPSLLDDDLTVTGRTDLTGSLNVGGATTIADDVTIDGSTSVGGELSVGDRGIIGGALDVAGKTTVGDNLEVNGLSSFNNDIKVDNGSTSLLTGPVIVDGKTDINNSLFVNNASPTDLSGSLHVVKNAVFDDDVLIDGMLTVNNNLNLPNLVVNGNGGAEGDHVALFENTGGTNADGIAIRIDNSELSAGNHFVTFYGQGSYMAGRIESFDSTSDMNNLPNDVNTNGGVSLNQGIVYGSKGADYAEWLEKENPTDTFTVGEVVGVKGGKISRNTEDADHVLTISLAPIVLGNMPDENRKDDFEKVGFMGQVPALVRGKVAKGDYIVASGKNDGYAVAIAPEAILLADMKGIIGKAWSASEGNGKSIINVSVGLKSNEWIKIMERQEQRIQTIEAQLKSLEDLSEKMKKLESKVDAIDMN